MSGKIYLLQENGALQGMVEQPYADEDLLQTLLEKYPDLLALAAQRDGHYMKGVVQLAAAA